MSEAHPVTDELVDGTAFAWVGGPGFVKVTVPTDDPYQQRVLRSVLEMGRPGELAWHAEGVAARRSSGTDGRTIVFEDGSDRVRLFDAGDYEVTVGADPLRRALARLVDVVLAAEGAGEVEIDDGTKESLERSRSALPAP